jgi:hypothetical protein
MLKSLGQWTIPSSKSRSVISPGITVATVSKPNADNKDKLENETTQDAGQSSST